MLHGQTPLIITQLNTSNLVSMGTEGNITPLFFDGSFIISVFEKRFFKMIETIKHIQLCITLEIRSVGSGIFLCPVHFSGRKEDIDGENRLIFWRRDHNSQSSCGS